MNTNDKRWRMVVYQIRTRENEDGEMGWERVADAPYLVTYGDTSFVNVPLDSRLGHDVRAYVNGIRVVGLQVVQSGDLVRIVKDGDEETTYCVGDRCGIVEPGAGRRCSFTGQPICGMAVRCLTCNRVFSLEVARQIVSCAVCRSFLCEDGHAELPEEELL